jgi:hypothetical protein
MIMRWPARVLVLLALAGARAGGGEGPFKGPTRDLAGPEGRVMIKVPEKWKDLQLSGNIIIRANAPGTYGGHNLRVEREAGQSDREKQRKRYLDYDTTNAPGAEVQKVDEPWFGYRLDISAKNRVLLRAFVTDGGDGLIVTVTSRLQYYDEVWAGQIAAIVSSVWISGVGAPRKPEEQGALRRIFDKAARVSLVAPGAWKSVEPDRSDELLYVGLKGSKSGPRFRFKDWGGPTDASLTLLKISGQWKKAYRNLVLKRLGNDPPSMLVRNRVPGSVDYLIAFDNAERGYTLILTVKEDSFERFRTVADAVAKSVVFSSAPYVEPEPPALDIRREEGKFAILHGAAEQASSVGKVARALGAFERHWKRVGVGKSRKKPPIHIVVCPRNDFEETAHHFGTPPAAYDRKGRFVVVVPPPPEEDTLPMWRGMLYGAIADNLLHRDVMVPAPAWLRAGLSACMDAAGRTGRGPDEGHPAFLKKLKVKTVTNAHKDIETVLTMTDADLYLAESPDRRMLAWGYVHLMNFGKGTVPSTYRRWKRALEAAEEKAPDFDLKTYEKARLDLQKHVARQWGTD